jgi:hypothetical protein
MAGSRLALLSCFRFTRIFWSMVVQPSAEFDWPDAVFAMRLKGAVDDYCQNHPRCWLACSPASSPGRCEFKATGMD